MVAITIAAEHTFLELLRCLGFSRNRRILFAFISLLLQVTKGMQHSYEVAANWLDFAAALVLVPNYFEVISVSCYQLLLLVVLWNFAWRSNTPCT